MGAVPAPTGGPCQRDPPLDTVCVYVCVYDFYMNSDISRDSYSRTASRRRRCVVGTESLTIKKLGLIGAMVLAAAIGYGTTAYALTSSHTITFYPSPNPPAGGFFPECAKGLAQTSNSLTNKSFVRTQIFYQPSATCNTALNRDAGWIGVYLLQIRVLSPGNNQICADSGWQYNGTVTYSFWGGYSLAGCGSGNYYTTGIHRYRPAGQGQVTSAAHSTGLVAL